MSEHLARGEQDDLQLYMRTLEFSWVQTLCDKFSIGRAEVCNHELLVNDLLVKIIIFCCFL
jgi:hypothetical protein